MDIRRFTATIRAVKFYPAAIFLFVVALIPNLQAQTKQQKNSSHAASKSANTATSFTLKDGRVARIENGRVMVSKSGENYTIAPGGRYTTREGKLLLVGNEGRLNNSTSLGVEVAPQPEAKRSVPTTNGRYHQTGSNL